MIVVSLVLERSLRLVHVHVHCSSALTSFIVGSFTRGQWYLFSSADSRSRAQLQIQRAGVKKPEKKQTAVISESTKLKLYSQENRKSISDVEAETFYLLLENK